MRCKIYGEASSGSEKSKDCLSEQFGEILRFDLPFDSKTVTMADLEEYPLPDWCKWKMVNPPIRESGIEEPKVA